MLLACPFCREMFDARERSSCPVCGVGLVPFDRLSPSTDAWDEDGVPIRPEEEPLPVWFWRRGRGSLVLVALLGLVAFMAPWIHVTMPDLATYSGLALARRLGWAWGAGVAWFVLLPTALSRRTIAQMRGARVATTFLGAVPGVTALVLLARPPHGSHMVPLRFVFGAGLYATLLLSILASFIGVLFGGRADDIRIGRGTSRGQLVH